MNNQETQKLRNLLAQRQWAPAIELLRKADPTSAADFFLSAPYDEQRALFHAMPVELAASLIVHLPYYHAYVLLHSLPSQEMRAVVEAMTPGERNHFLDALPEEAWQCLMDELAEAGTGAPYCAVPDTGTDAGAVTTEFAPPAVDIEPIIQARQIEKSYQQPDGRQIQVIAPVDFSVEAEHHHRAARPIGLGKIHAAANSFRACGTFGRRSFVARQAHEWMPAKRGHRVSEFRAFSVAHGAGKRGSAFARARHHAF